MLACVFGPRGSGKSVMVRYMLRNQPRVIVIDPMQEMMEGRSDPSHERILPLKSFGFEQVEVADAIDRIEEGRTGRLKLVVIPREPQKVIVLMRACLLMGAGTVAIDEAEKWYTNKADPPDVLVEHVERGRHYNLDLILATRRPARLWRTATANADFMVMFKTWEPNDRKYLEEYAPKVKGQWDRLEKHQAFVYAPATATVSLRKVSV